jgi:serine/threonine protein kinase
VLKAAPIKDDKAIDVWSIGIILYIMIYKKNPFEKAGAVTRDTIKKDSLKFSSKVSATDELKEVIQSMVCKAPLARLKIPKILQLDWFKFTDSDLEQKMKELEDIKEMQLKRKEYLERKEALRGNKFINDEGKVVITNRNLNRDIRDDLL